ncbi:hypothetical protein JY651_25940 [Pyxidicoccus parkwayensis]|uniref:Phospholipase C/D domain-containing protein n=1 Tax=Pyxidicoccus parkwayensis TaxID=2813578 RepID=A0ABX7PCN8_9BACT|nr:hypothetical protein [Pyxidicoccus parkwaysis]QSQ28264.1 hypothetical protein JY651_25940 [Pyxidicoccus parkwaysis]
MLLAVGLAPRAQAFSVEDHRALTASALDAAVASGSGAGLKEHREAVLHGATAEDLNLHVKWMGWHHFYRPEGHLHSALREGSDARVRALWDEALEAARHGDMARAWDRAGHLAHHIEDMASPPHVVPVMHGLGDGFEDHGLGASLSRMSPRDVAPLSGVEAQVALARETLDAVRTQSLTTRDGTAIPWSAFWSEPDARSPGTFGVYGAVGNAFGQARVRWQGHMHEVDPASVDAFLDARASAAVAYVRAFLEWAAARFDEVSAPDMPHLSLLGFRPPPELSLQAIGGVARDARGTAPLAGLRAALPLPHALTLSVDWLHGLEGGTRPHPSGGWALAVQSPPLWAWRPGYSLGVDLRATAGVALYSWEGGSRLGVPVGLRAHVSLGGPFVASTEVLYQAVHPFSASWAHGVTWTVGFGMALGDR